MQVVQRILLGSGRISDLRDRNYCPMVSHVRHRCAHSVRGITPVETLRNVTRLVHERFRYAADLTNAQTTTPEFVALGAGVCQDFAHLALALRRSHDVGARYVSGYFFTDRPSRARSPAMRAPRSRHT